MPCTMYILVKGDEGASVKGHDIDTMNLRQGVHFELGMPSAKKSAVFLNIVQKAFDPPPPFI